MAPPMRMSVTTHGVTAPLAMIILETGDINPHIVFAPNMAACPFKLKSIVLHLVLRCKITIFAIHLSLLSNINKTQ